MDRKIILSKKAKEQIKEIHNIILDLSKDEDTAKRYINGLLDKMEILRRFAFTGRELKLDENTVTIYRYLHYKKYCIFYRVEDDKVYIDRILNGRLDYVKEFIDKEDNNEND